MEAPVLLLAIVMATTSVVTFHARRFSNATRNMTLLGAADGLFGVRRAVAAVV